MARERQEAEGIDQGLIVVWSCLESARSYRARYCAETGYPQLRHHSTACKHLYLYFDHEDYGWMNIRVQTWFPYPIQICMNGREWLRRGLEAESIEFLHQGNKFFHVDDYARAQRLLNQQLDTRWPQVMVQRELPRIWTCAGSTQVADVPAWSVAHAYQAPDTCSGSEHASDDGHRA